jgi:hypothetical protein
LRMNEAKEKPRLEPSPRESQPLLSNQCFHRAVKMEVCRGAALCGKRDNAATLKFSRIFQNGHAFY